MSEIALEAARERFLEGIAHYEAGRLEAARASFEAALTLAPGRPSVLANLGITLYGLKRFGDAVPVLREAAAADATQPDVWFSLGLSLEALAQWREAATALERGLALVPARSELWLVCGQCHERAGAYDAALAAFERVLALDPNHAAAWSARGGVLRDLGRLDEAASCFERALELGADAELNRYYLAAVRGTRVPAPPRTYVEALFDQYAADFQAHLVDALQYRGHEWLATPLIGGGRRYRSVLDLGCGTGLCGALLAPHADHLVGVDLSAAMLEQARKLGVYHELVHADIGSFLAQPTRCADLVLAADVFIYVGALDEIFPAARRVLEPGGTFAFTVERAPDTVDFQLRPSLRYAHSEAYIRRLASAHGFAVRELRCGPLRQNREAPLEALYVYLE